MGPRRVRLLVETAESREHADGESTSPLRSRETPEKSQMPIWTPEC